MCSCYQSAFQNLEFPKLVLLAEGPLRLPPAGLVVEELAAVCAGQEDVVVRTYTAPR